MQVIEEGVMDMESLQLKVLYCERRAEQARHGDARQQWLAAADSWRQAIKYRIAVPHLIEWSSLKRATAGLNRTLLK